MVVPLDEHAVDRRVPAMLGFALGHSGHVELGIYFDRVLP
jgi:hypothetical protein